MKKETYYEILKIKPNASDSDIVSAYHKAKAAFSQDSVAAYSILDPSQSEEILKQIEEAYAVLSNLDNRRKYDQMLAEGRTESFEVEHKAVSGSDITAAKHAPHLERRADPGLSLADTAELPRPSTTPSGDVWDPQNGSGLAGVRQRCDLSVDEVARITKIPKRYLLAIENDDFKNMPARVYVQGFVKSLCTLYRLPAAETVKDYLAFYDENTKPSEG